MHSSPQFHHCVPWAIAAILLVKPGMGVCQRMHKEYESLLQMFPKENPGVGIEVVFDGVSEQPMTYGLIVSAESTRLRESNTDSDRTRITHAVEWLLQAKDLDNDGELGWGLPHAWDAFQDGTVNPENHPYTITTAIVMQGLMDALTLNFWDDQLRSEMEITLKGVALRWCRYAWTSDTESTGYFWYSASQYDAIPTANVNGFMAGVLARLTDCLSGIFEEAELSLIKQKTDGAIRFLIERVTWHQGLPFWVYSTPGSRTNDLVHHSYILWGIESYRESGGNVAIPWPTNVSLGSLSLFFSDDRRMVYEYPLQVPIGGVHRNVPLIVQVKLFIKRLLGIRKPSRQLSPARLWGVGAALAVVSRWGGGVTDGTHQLMEILRLQYGPYPHLGLYPYSSREFYSRYAAHVLWGLALAESGR